MIFTFLNGDVIKTSEIVLISRIEKLYTNSKFLRRFYYNITLNNKIEIERNLAIVISEGEIFRQFRRGLLSISVEPVYIMNDVKRFGDAFVINARDVFFDNIKIPFEEMDSFKFFNQERLDLINKLT